MKYPQNMDPECVAICDAMNALPGITTFESCCGHGKHEHWIFFWAGSLENLEPILRCAYSSAWNVKAGWHTGIPERPYFLLEGPIGPAAAPGSANDFASWLLAMRAHGQT